VVWRTQWVHFVCHRAVTDTDATVLFVDTSHSFSPERLATMAGKVHPPQRAGSDQPAFRMAQDDGDLAARLQRVLHFQVCVCGSGAGSPPRLVVTDAFRMLFARCTASFLCCSFWSRSGFASRRCVEVRRSAALNAVRRQRQGTYASARVLVIDSLSALLAPLHGGKSFLGAGCEQGSFAR
jgi:hypothetical protein